MSEQWDNLRAKAEQAQAARDLVEAQRYWQEALREADRFSRLDRRISLTLEGLAEVYWHMGKFDEATDCCRKLKAIYSELFGPEQFDVGVICTNLAMLHHVRQQYNEAEDYYRQALAIKSKHLGKDHPDIAKLLGNYTNLLHAMNRVDEANKLKSGETIITARNWSKTKTTIELGHRNGESTGDERAFMLSDGDDDDDDGSRGKRGSGTNINREPLSLAVSRWETLRRLAEDMQQKNCLAEAEAVWAASVRYFEPFAAEDPRRMAYALDSMADSLCAVDRHEMAEAFYRKALDIKAKHLGAQHVVVARSLNNLAKLYYQLNRFNEAEPLAQQCIEIYAKLFGTDHPDYATALHNLGTLYHIQVRYADAEPLYRKALVIRQRSLGPSHPETLGLARSLANLLIATGREAEAAKVYGEKSGVITGTWRTLAVPEDQQLLPSSP